MNFNATCIFYWNFLQKLLKWQSMPGSDYLVYSSWTQLSPLMGRAGVKCLSHGFRCAHIPPTLLPRNSGLQNFLFTCASPETTDILGTHSCLWSTSLCLLQQPPFSLSFNYVVYKKEYAFLFPPWLEILIFHKSVIKTSKFKFPN